MAVIVFCVFGSVSFRDSRVSFSRLALLILCFLKMVPRQCAESMPDLTNDSGDADADVEHSDTHLDAEAEALVALVDQQCDDSKAASYATLCPQEFAQCNFEDMIAWFLKCSSVRLQSYINAQYDGYREDMPAWMLRGDDFDHQNVRRCRWVRETYYKHRRDHDASKSDLQDVWELMKAMLGGVQLSLSRIGSLEVSLQRSVQDRSDEFLQFLHDEWKSDRSQLPDFLLPASNAIRNSWLAQRCDQLIATFSTYGLALQTDAVNASLAVSTVPRRFVSSTASTDSDLSLDWQQRLFADGPFVAVHTVGGGACAMNASFGSATKRGFLCVPGRRKAARVLEHLRKQHLAGGECSVAFSAVLSSVWNELAYPAASHKAGIADAPSSESQCLWQFMPVDLQEDCVELTLRSISRAQASADLVSEPLMSRLWKCYLRALESGGLSYFFSVDELLAVAIGARANVAVVSYDGGSLRLLAHSLHQEGSYVVVALTNTKGKQVRSHFERLVPCSQVLRQQSNSDLKEEAHGVVAGLALCEYIVGALPPGTVTAEDLRDLEWAGALATPYNVAEFEDFVQKSYRSCLATLPTFLQSAEVNLFQRWFEAEWRSLLLGFFRRFATVGGKHPDTFSKPADKKPRLF